MFEHFDECPFILAWQEKRLLAARKLSEAGIPCMIYGEDALAYAHFVPTMQFDLHIVVADANKDAAAALIARTLHFKPYTGGQKHCHESIFADANLPLVYPYSAHLEITPASPVDGPHMVLVHPQSFFNLAVDDHSRSISLPPFPDNIRFPTLTAFLDSIYDTIVDPSSGHRSRRGAESLVRWASYLFDYTIRRPFFLPNGDLKPEVAELKSSLRPENQPAFDQDIRDKFSAEEVLQMRREVFRQMGRLDLANRPPPTRAPGNRAPLEQLRALKAARASEAKVTVSA
ncbi:hypothetical protein D9613_006160 [Agrocybe pediades]|uniref:Uncharacterized protein n=1 Tax=Agrocybe pediades TaxID=84607 RepID=A0A8H4VP47_9AGAR|nr:hypothetical protein D9613_006160 [Agrocybe pediades]KAF9565787.1 hypothetical protein CPC08DRAFT_747802 [Agrocybe pediades]